MADQVNESPEMLLVLQYIEKAGFIQNGSTLELEVVAILQGLAQIGLVDPGFSVSSNGSANGVAHPEVLPAIWLINGTGRQVLRHLEVSPLPSKLPRTNGGARNALATLSASDRLNVMVATAKLVDHDPRTWPKEKVERLSEENSTYVLRVAASEIQASPPELRVIIKVYDSGELEIFDIMLAETFEWLRRSSRVGSKAG